MKIIVDAFGGDNAPLEIIKGSRSAKNDFGVDIALVGDKEKIFSCAAQNKISLNDIDIIDAPDVIAMTDQPGEILKSKKKGNYNVVAIDPDYKPAPVEHKQVYGITFEQGRNELTINADTMLTNWVTENKSVTEEQKRDLIIALITLKYTQSNSVCYTAGGQTIGVGAGQQSRIHCTRLAGQKADNWQLRHMDKVLNLPFRDDIAKPNRDNAIDVYIGDTPEDVIGDDVWAETFTEQPEPLTAEEKKEYLSHVTGVCLGSDAFFPFGDNIERARRSGVTAIVQPGGSIRDQQVIDTCNKYGIAMAFCGIRLFHH